jgi:serine/threonine protein kinase
MPTPPDLDRQTFLANLRESGLLSADELAAVAERLPASNRGRVVARALVRLGLLTRFQADQLLAGHTRGFHLGQYRILDLLGQGGMGRVYKARHRAMGRIVALKVLGPHLLKTQKAQELFEREVRAISRLTHPNIVTAYDADQVGKRYYLVLEYVDGPNLHQLVRQQGPLPVSQACDFVRQIADGLQYAFEMGLVHRDIKPANVLVQRRVRDGRVRHLVKISDFGLARLYTAGPNARAANPGTITIGENAVMGTPDYVSPEQARNLHAVDIRSDLYSLGCTLYYLLTGRVPFPGDTPLEKLIRHTTEAAKPVERLRRETPPGVAAIVRRLMAKDPAARFQTPAAVAAALAPFADTDATSWTALEPTDPFMDLLATPFNQPRSPAPPSPVTPLSTTVSTGSGPPAPEPLPPPAPGTAEVPALLTATAADTDLKRRVTIALPVAVGIVGGLLAAAWLVYG